ncbi:MAG: T9SS type A sorting domain-containing protein [Flavobacteriaceae bacterium]|nr:T9SS type A sorting domain-containing protein [Flavobacteriaceae bacterium]
MNFNKLLLFIASVSILSCNNSSEKITSENNQTKTSPHDFMFMQRAYPTGEIKTDAYSKAIQWKKQQTNRNSNAAVIWEFAGPLNIGGRITDLEIPIDQAQTYYVGAASGGIFKTTDAGANWIPIFDDQEMLSIGDMEISKNNTDLIWVGTGEVNAGGGSLAYDGNGMYKSADGGLTWEAKGLPASGSISKVLIDPNDDTTIFAGAMGPLFKKDNNRGVYRSTNDGADWEQVLFVSDSTGIIDMAIHPNNGNIVYAASWERIRRPNNRQYGGETSRIYRSQNGGDSWTELTNGLPSNANDKGRISIDISQSNPDVLYAFYSDKIGNVEGTFKTTNGGDSWTQVNSVNNGTSYHWWFGGIFVDPTDENVIYNSSFIMEKSSDGGQTWNTTFPGVHVDQQAMAFNASVLGEVLIGNDGGLYKSSNNGNTSTKINDLPITQFYRFYVDAQNSDKVYGGAQDNNTIRTQTGGLSDWQAIYGGDGFQPLVDPTNTNVIYAMYQRGNLGKSTNNGASFSGATSGISSGDTFNWDTALCFDPNDSQTLFYGTQRVYKTTNAAGNWSSISPDLSNGPHTGNLAFGTVTTINVSPLNSDVIYAGTDDGNVWVTQNGGGNWTKISATLPNLWTTKVLASRDDPATVYITFSGYRYGEDNGHIFKSTDFGATWNDISSNLPDIPINDIEKDQYGNLFLGTDVGVLASLDEGVTWQPLGENMPSVVVTDLFIHENSEYLYVGTYGRSSYKLNIANDVLRMNSNIFETEIKLYPNPASNFINIVFENPSEGVSVIIYDQLGRIVLSKEFISITSEKRISLEGTSTGNYYVQIISEGHKTTKKLLVK